MLFLEMNAGEVVFNYGDVGDQFYIIIEGEISIMTPFPEVLEGEQVSPYPILIYFLTFFKNIDWNFISCGK